MMHYDINSVNAPDFLTVKTQGQMNSNDFIKMAEMLLKHPASKSGGNVLFDHTELEFEGVTPAELRAIRDYHRAHEAEIGGGRSAILLRDGEADAWHRLWSQGDKLQTANQVQVFENCDDAIAWISGRL